MVLVRTCVHGDVGVLSVVVIDLPWFPCFLSESLHRPESSVAVGMLNGFWPEELSVVVLFAGGYTCIGLDCLMGDCPGEADR